MQRRQKVARDNTTQFRYWSQFDLGKVSEGDLEQKVRDFYPELDGTNACRDYVGGTLLHWCMLLGVGKNGNPAYRQIADYIIHNENVAILDQQFDRRDPCVHVEMDQVGFVKKQKPEEKLPYEDLYYDGETALHIAVAKNDVDMVGKLLERGVSCQIRAYGSFFVPGGPSGCYLGEYALSFAASGGLDEILEMLYVHDKNSVTYRDSFSNTALHMAILYSRISTYKLLAKLTGKSHEELVLDRGSMGMTPLSLAALSTLRTGDMTSYEYLINSTRSVVWEFLDVTSYSYPLKQIDTIPCPPVKKDGARSVQSVQGDIEAGPLSEKSDPEPIDYVSILFLAIQYDLLSLAEDEIIVALLESKWVFLKYIFYVSILWHFAYLGVLTSLTVLAHPYGDDSEILEWIAIGMTIVDALPSMFDIMAGISNYKWLKKTHVWAKNRAAKRPERLDEAAWETYQSYEKSTIGKRFSFAKQMVSSFPLSGFDLVAWVGYGLFAAHCVIDDGIEDHVKGSPPLDKDSEPVPYTLVFLGMSTMCAWISTLTYAPVHERTGMLVTMMTRTIFQDLLPFILVFSFILMGAATGAFSLQRKGYTILKTLDTLKRLSIGLYDHENYEPEGHGDGALEVSYVLILLFTLVSLVLMLNLLIATFTSTYEEVKDLAHKEWRLLWGRDILMLERRALMLSGMVPKLRVNHGSPEQHVYVSISNKIRDEEKKTKKHGQKSDIVDCIKMAVASHARSGYSPKNRKASLQLPPPQEQKDNPLNAPVPTSTKKRKRKKKSKDESPSGSDCFSKSRPMPHTEETKCSNCGAVLNYTTFKYPVKVWLRRRGLKKTN